MRLPFLQIDLDIVESNIRSMVEIAKQLKLELRPHFKTHQSQIIGQLIKQQGVTGITVSSAYMAKYFVQNGWDDITIAFPASLLSANMYNDLAKSASLKLLAVDNELVQRLDKEIFAPISMYIEIDPGYGRSGIPYDDMHSIGKVFTAIHDASQITFEGFYCHAGHTYHCTSKSEIIALTDPVINNLKKLKSKFGGKLCYGDTPSCSVRNSFDGIDQISPGNFVFYDWMQTQIGSCTSNQIGVTMKCEVVAKYPKRNEVLIHGGAVHFSKDYITNNNGERVFGVLVSSSEHESPSFLKSLSQEHGLLSCSQTDFNSINFGDVLEFYPIHSCLTANLMREYVTEAGELIPQFGSGSPYQL